MSEFYLRVLYLNKIKYLPSISQISFHHYFLLDQDKISDTALHTTYRLSHCPEPTRTVHVYDIAGFHHNERE